ncbi:MAG: DNA-binding response regulator [Rhodospirillales bacterium RIFCSPLOWO2_12_FULL_58_28]|nr:MAG: DNA-binding response regulator [Rhodospirillales bacterium RIFCSPLOWO2_02_FULL_58_16]OHC77396.1 MAG: DNA-binding response regulator [Rhodospirillales bacterium RIFCSPLOWO2_12_FULL_58_28]
MISGKRVLLVDDGPTLLQMLGEQLQLREEFTTVGTGTGAEALALAQAEHFDAIILDAGLPDMNGGEVCRLMRRNGVLSPIIMLTSPDAGAGIICGPDGGADDYIVKPFRLGVLLAKLRAHISRRKCGDDAVFMIGPYIFQPGAKLLTDRNDEKKVRLTDKETAILKYLYHAGDRIISREVLLDEVWGYNAGVTTHTLETHIYRLRQKIEPDPSDARLLITEQGGYRLAP